MSVGKVNKMCEYVAIYLFLSVLIALVVAYVIDGDHIHLMKYILP